MPKHSVFRRIITYCTILGFILFICILIGTAVGAVNLSLKSVFLVIWKTLCGGHCPANPEAATIVLQLRLPRILLAALVGMALSVAGVALQGLLMNPLADPYIVGVSSGAAVGAAIAITLGIGGILWGFGTAFLAFFFALLSMALVYFLSRVGGKVPVQTFLLAGIVVGSFMWALVNFLMFVSQGPDQGLQQVVTWVMGSFSDADWTRVDLSLPLILLGGIALLAMARELNVMAFGEDTARSLGVDPEQFKRRIILIASLITAAAVSVSGIIGFVGLVVPHITRRIVGPDHRILLPASALLGSSLMIIADTLARTIVAPGELPVGVITALLGAPFFCYLLHHTIRGKNL